MNKELFKLTDLTDLSLEHNRFSEVPAEISQLVNLTGINLNNNKLKILPDEIYTLEKVSLGSMTYFEAEKLNS